VVVTKLYVLALLAIAGTASAQAQTQPPEEIVAESAGEMTEAAEEVTQPAEEVADPAELQTSEAVPAAEPEAAAAEPEESDAELLKADYQLATKQYRTCRQRAMGQGGLATAAKQCGSQRKRMLMAKEAMRGG
jgi:type IV secretory pathway VirB10-like protein